MKLTKLIVQVRAQSDAQQTTVCAPQSWLTVALLVGTLFLNFLADETF